MTETDMEAFKEFLVIDGKGQDSSLTFMLAMDKLPVIDAEKMVKTIEHYEEVEGGVTACPIVENKCLGTVSFGKHRFRWMGIDAPLPKDTYGGPLKVSHLEKNLKIQFIAHQAHILLWYIGEETDPIERYIAMYKVVDCFNEGFCGLLNSTANVFNSAITPAAMREHLLNIRHGLPPLMFVNVVTLFKPDGGTWYVSNGNSVFGLPEFAYQGANGQLQTVVGLFQTWVWESHKAKRSLSKGDILEVEGFKVVLDDLYEYEEFIKAGITGPVYVLNPDTEKNARTENKSKKGEDPVVFIDEESVSHEPSPSSSGLNKAVLFICGFMVCLIVAYFSGMFSNKGGGEKKIQLAERGYTKSQILTYFRNLGFYHTRNTADQVTKKWVEDILIYQAGEWPGELQGELRRIINDLKPLIKGISISTVGSKEDANFIIFAGNAKDYKKIALNSDAANLAVKGSSMFWINWNGSHEIYKGNAYIDPDRIQTADLKKTLLRKVFTRSLGLMGTSNLYTDSIFYNNANSICSDYSKIDRLMIKLLYRRELNSNLKYEHAKKIIKEKHLIDVVNR